MNRKIACLTLDVEADFLDPHGRIRLFEDEALFKRYIDILRARRVKLTAFLVTSLIERYAAMYRRLQERLPLEFAVHSHAHDLENPCSRADIEASIVAFRNFAGQRPAGYRAPLGQITPQGMEALLDFGFRYDSSLYPSFRPGKLGYNNLHLPCTPFRIRRGAQSIIEVPFAALRGARLVFSLSYVKVFGWPAYRFLLSLFPLPAQIAVLSHPYDHYFYLLADGVRAWEKPFLQRNARTAFTLLEKMLDFLIEQGYEFESMSGLCDALEADALPEWELAQAIRT